MGFFNGLRETRAANLSLDQWDKMLLAMEFGEESSSGVTVSALSATRQATVFSCINILSRDMAALGLELFERKPDGGRAAVSFHPVAEWLKNPNGAMTPFQYRQLRWTHKLIYGNDFSLVNKRDSMTTWPLHPDAVTVGISSNGAKQYRFTDAHGQKHDYQSRQMLHSFGLSFDGVTGISPIRWNMEAMGRAIAVGEYAASYFKSPVPKVILQAAGGMKDKQERDDFIAAWTDRFAGKKGMATAAILPQSLTLSQVVKVPNNEAQFIETSRFTKEEIAQIYLMPMHRLQGLERATFSNIEHLDLEYTKYTLAPWLKADEEAMEHQFLSAEERNRFFIRHNMETLLRGDYKTRMDGHRAAVGGPFRTVNETRALENMEALDKHDEILTPLNMAPRSEWAPKAGGNVDGTPN